MAVAKIEVNTSRPVGVIRVGVQGPPGLSGGGAYDDSALVGRMEAVELALGSIAAPYDDSALSARVSALEGATVAWSDLANVPTNFMPSAHTHQIADVTGLTAQLADKADQSTVWTLEALQDAVAAMFQSGTHTNATITYDDAIGALSITASGGVGETLTQEEVEDFVGSLLLSGTGINVTYDDAGNVLSIALSGESYTTADKNKLAGIASGATANATNAELRDRATHTGAQAISTVTGLQTALDGKQPVTNFKTINGTAITGSGDIVIPSGADGSSVTVRTYTVLADAEAAQVTYPNDIIVLKDP